MPAIELDPQGFNEVRVCRHGPMLYNRNDAFVGRSLSKYGEFSWFECELFRQIVRPGQLVVEVGANIGAHTVFLSSLVGARGAVLAFEPQRLVFQALCANLALNQCINVHAFHQALGETTGQLRFPGLNPYVPTNFGGLSLLGEHNDGEVVPVRTLDELAIPACHFLKADVEGMEIEVLRGAVGTINRYRPVMYLENDRSHRSKGLLEMVLGMNYKAYWHLPPLFNPENFASDTQDIFPGIVSVNILCFPAELSISATDFREILSPDDDWKSPPGERLGVKASKV